MRIVVAGASGFLGTNLRQLLDREGHEVLQLVRRAPTSAGQREWDPDRGELDPAALAGADAVVNLAGVGPGDKRWTPSFRRLIITSRMNPTRTIAGTLAGMPPGERPSVLVNASGVYYYGDTGDTIVTERSPKGPGFMADLCQAWEAATAPADRAGVRVVRLRTGLVLGPGGPMFELQKRVFRLFLGGKMGNGRQWMPWIALDDWLAAVSLLLRRDDLSGPFNMAAPNPSRNVDYTKALARAVHRPAVFPTPRFGVRLVIGRFGTEAMASVRALPEALTESGFRFRHPELDSAIDAAMH